MNEFLKTKILFIQEYWAQLILIMLFIGVVGFIGWYDYNRPPRETIILPKNQWVCSDSKTTLGNYGGRLIPSTKCVEYRKIVLN